MLWESIDRPIENEINLTNSSTEETWTYGPIVEFKMPVASSSAVVQYLAKSPKRYFRPLFPSAALIALKYSTLSNMSEYGEILS